MQLQLTHSYETGKHREVWSQLSSIGDFNNSDLKDEALSIARLAMKRVRRNIEILIARWVGRGHQFGYDWVSPRLFRSISKVALQTPLLGTPGIEEIAAMDRFEDEIGPIPIVMRAFYEVIGGVNFGGRIANSWPDECSLDPLQILAFTPQSNRLIERKWKILEVAEDPCHKYLYSGVGSIYVPLPSLTFDPPILFEDSPFLLNDVPLTFGNYLRQMILEFGGIGAAFNGSNWSELVDFLTKDLEEF